ncbi:MAG: hypothetical protein QGG09_14545, partial [Pirellulaceae bacterium]|nr:hypothetical protein [Pirellulaceae bacterium]
GSHGTAILNKTAARHMRTTIDAVSSAFHLHVGDGIFVGTDERMTNRLMHDTADALERVGFEVNDRRESQPVVKLIGYESVRRPPTLRFLLEKGVRLERAMGWLACCQFVFVDAVSSLLGIWIHGALLRRDLLSIGNHIFLFVEKHRGQRVKWWPSARVEFLTMSRCIPLMSVSLASPRARTVFASDAQGGGEQTDDDAGGYGIVATTVASELVDDLWRSSFVPGKCVAKLDGTLGSKWGSRSSLVPTTPFTRVPRSIFDSNWHTLAAGRWLYRGHITLGEARAHVRIFQALAAIPSAHAHTIAALEDDGAVSCAMAKGRSPAPGLNFYVRKRAASVLAADISAASPWVETGVMPADAASRGFGTVVPGPVDCGSCPECHHQKVHGDASKVPFVLAAQQLPASA